MTRHQAVALTVFATFLAHQIAQATESRTLCDFEDSKAVSLWDFPNGKPQLVAEGVTSGKRALEITFDPGGTHMGGYMSSYRLPQDWSSFDALELDVLNPNSTPVAGLLLIGDEPWRQKNASYWNRHNAKRMIPVGATRWVIPVQGLYRGEAGSRNSDIRSDIDPSRIVRLDFGFGKRGSSGRLILDNLRLVKASVPTGVWAFDFGPPDQAVMPGWTGVSHLTSFTAERGYGWGPQGGAPWNGTDRDTTFGPSLLRDFCEARGFSFRVAVPAGRYRVAVCFESSGYWGGEQAQHRWRRISANSRLAWEENRADGPSHALYRFEQAEPVGADMWETYLASELARPAEFEAEAEDKDGLNLRFESDRAWGCKVAALSVARVGDRRAAEWLDGERQALEQEFRSQAVNLDPPAPPLAPGAAWQKTGLAAWPLRVEDDLSPDTVPSDKELAASPERLALARRAVRGETELFALAVRPLRDLGECLLTVEHLTGPGRLEGDAQVMWYSTRRDFGVIAYHVSAHTLRSQQQLRLPPAVTRGLAVRVRVPDSAAPGEYLGALVIRDADEEVLLRVPLSLNVAPVTLCRDTDFLMGFYGLMPPGLVPEEKRWTILEETLRLLREYGMNAVSGGPSWRLTGWRDGRPELDTQEMDRFCALLKTHGFGCALNGYGGARFVGLHDGYQSGQIADKVGKQSGLPYRQAVLRAWEMLDAHARSAGWPLILYAMCDETRVREVAERELSFMNVMAEVSKRYPDTLRTSGSYSVHFRSLPDDAEDLTYWHQRFFKALDVSSLNDHDETALAEAKRLGKEIHIYNQGTSRYSFGLYQWNEYAHGVRARWEWHLNVLHGYQFFDLDGREPDMAMLCYGRNAIYPTLAFERCREGAEDFYLCQMLAKLDPDSAVLRHAADGIRMNNRNPPQGFDADAFKARLIDAILAASNLQEGGKKAE